MTRITYLLASLTALFCMSAAPKEDAAKTDKEAIQGTWKFVTVLDQGKEQPWPDGNRLVITADVLKIVYPKDEARGWNYTIDPSKDPKEMDWLAKLDPTGHPIRQLAIYSLEGDTLKICSTAAGKPRPTMFESKRGDFGGLWVLKRVPPPSPKEAAK